MQFWNIIFGALILLLITSGIFDVIDWKWNIPALALVFLFWVGSMYNSLVSLKNRAKEAWADILVQLKRRYDLIPNLVNTVRGYMTHERETLEKITRARTSAMGAGSMSERAKDENMISGALKSIFALAENYPDLKANQNFIELQRELSDTENKIQAARRFYNTNVRDLNTMIESFPQNMLASMFGFKQQEFFELGEGESAAKNPVHVQF